MAKYKVKVDRDACIGCGVCANIAPDIFEIDEENKSKVILEEIDDSKLSAAEEAKNSCPVSAITIEEA